MRFLFLSFLFFPLFCLGQNQLPEITNLTATADLGAGILTIEYDLSDAELDSMEIFLEVSDDLGNTFLIETSNATGDIGFPVLAGNGKQISWIYLGRITDPGDYVIKLVADDRFKLDIQELVNQVDSNRLKTDLEYLCGIRNPNTGLAHLEEVKDSLEQLFMDNMLQTERQQFPFAGYQAHNIIGRYPGTVEEEVVYIVDAHFDTVNNSPGADDNASGVAGVMEAMRILTNYTFKKSIKFIGFDMEEVGLVGSTWYANLVGPPEYEETAGVFNLEMIGYFDDNPNTQTLPPGFELLFPDITQQLQEDEFRGNFISLVGLTNYESLNNAFSNAAATYVPDLKVIPLIAPEAFVPQDLLRSDHAPFWQVGIPAIMLTDGANFRNINYHTPDDEFNSLDFTFMTHVVQATIGAIAEVAEIQHSSAVQTTVSIPTSVQNSLDCTLQIMLDSGGAELLINMESCSSLPELVQLWSINGQLMQQQRLQAISSLRLPVSAYPPGMYILKLQNSRGQLVQKVLVP